MHAMDVTARIAEAVELGHAGNAEEARGRLAELWEDAEVQADPLHRCTLAHHAADLQTTVIDELAWDLRALEAAGEVTPERARAHHPSLHLNLGDAYLRLGDAAGACHHLERARACLDRLPDDGYGRMIRAGVESLGQRFGDH